MTRRDSCLILIVTHVAGNGRSVPHCQQAVN